MFNIFYQILLHSLTYFTLIFFLLFSYYFIGLTILFVLKCALCSFNNRLLGKALFMSFQLQD